tara:strand:- start:204 stop:1184 length:981 start_codon:yes stop_codon:yes gene_type:complete
MKKVLVTGCAGFIGYHTCLKFLEEKFHVVGIDNLNSYYDIKLKKERLKLLNQNKKFKFEKLNIENKKLLISLFNKNKFLYVINLAAQAGVRHSISNPQDYIFSNILGFYNLIDVCKNKKIKNFVYASSSSVYGTNTNLPYKEEYKTDTPMSLYAATKKTNEIIAYSYSHIHKIKTTGLRFFTVYGPWGRPDMALYEFTNKISNNKSIKVFNYGKHKRDFTYIDDIVNGIFLTALRFEKSYKKQSMSKIYNLSSNKPIELNKFISEIEKNIGKKAKKIFLPMQLGDVEKTHGSNTELKKDFGYEVKVDYKKGINNFIKWYKEYHKII